MGYTRFLKALFILFCGLFFSPNLIWAKENLGEYLCKAQIEKFFLEQGVHNSWQKITDIQPFVKRYASPTNSFGKWVLVEKSKTGELKAQILTSDQRQTVDWIASKSCAIQKKSFPIPFDGDTLLQKKAIWFTDQILKQKMAEPRKTVLYIWSPGMVYSWDHLPAFESAAKSLGFDFLPILGPASNESLVSQLENLVNPKTGRKNEPIVRNVLLSTELKFRGAENHYPSTFVIGNGRISSRIVGVMQRGDLEIFLSAAASELELSPAAKEIK